MRKHIVQSNTQIRSNKQPKAKIVKLHYGTIRITEKDSAAKTTQLHTPQPNGPNRGELPKQHQIDCRVASRHRSIATTQSNQLVERNADLSYSI